MKQFTREQNLFIVETALQAALDQIETCLPTAGLDWDDRKALCNGVDEDPMDLVTYERSALEMCGAFLAEICVQQTGLWQAPWDALDCGSGMDFGEACRKLVSYAWKNKGRACAKKSARGKSVKSIYGKRRPNCRKYAESFVDNLLGLPL